MSINRKVKIGYGGYVTELHGKKLKCYNGLRVCITNCTAYHVDEDNDVRCLAGDFWIGKLVEEAQDIPDDIDPARKAIMVDLGKE
jgi:hypothetical protein